VKDDDNDKDRAGASRPSVSRAVAELRSPRTVRVRCQRVLEAGLRGELAHFRIDLARMQDTARITAEITRTRYPDLRVPPHSRFAHFDAGGVPRLARLEADIAHHDALERARILTDVVVTSVLLDAGAGMQWRYTDEDGSQLARSEGLAVASLAWAKQGGLSSTHRAYHVDAAGLQQVDAASLERAFQVRDDNPLVGVEGRVHLLRALGAALQRRPDVFSAAGRIGSLVDHLRAQAEGGVLEASVILGAILDGLGEIWPGRIERDGVALGDVWPHPAAGGEGASLGLVPFHKLSQWLSYSLLHPLAVAGLRVIELDALTGLAEYRNGGLFIDGGVLVPHDPGLLAHAHDVSSQVVVEWRALTVGLLDRIADLVRGELGLDAARMPLAAVLEGGTWAAGRELARQRRSDGGPPLRVISDGTVF
jgi:hypothetical protein